MSAELVCDFCRAPDPEWEYPARDVFIEAIKWESFGPWCACETCSMLIAMEEHDALARRAEVMTGIPEGVNRMIQDRFFQARAGPARPIKVTPLHGRIFQR